MINRYHSFLLRMMLGVGIIGLNFILSKALTPAIYGQIAFFIYILKSLNYSTFGVNQGFIFFSLREKASLYFYTYALFYSFIALISVGIVSYIFGVYVAILLLIIFPLFVIEPYLKTQKNFYFVYFPEVILLVSFALVAFYDPGALNQENYLFVAFLSALLVILLLGTQKANLQNLFLNSKRRVRFRALLYMLERGQGVYWFSVLFIVFMLIDRYLYSSVFGGEALGGIMLAFNFVLAFQFIVTTLNASSVVELGEEFREKGYISKKHFLHKTRKVFLIGLTLYFVGGISVYVLHDLVFREYESLFELYLIVGFGMFFYNVYSSVSNTLFFYEKKVFPVFIFVFLVLLVVVNLKFMAMKIGFLNAVIFDFVGLAMCSSVLLVYAYYWVVRKEPKICNV